MDIYSLDDCRAFIDALEDETALNLDTTPTTCGARHATSEGHWWLFIADLHVLDISTDEQPITACSLLARRHGTEVYCTLVKADGAVLWSFRIHAVPA